jgi:hypothetical protein
VLEIIVSACFRHPGAPTASANFERASRSRITGFGIVDEQQAL